MRREDLQEKHYFRSSERVFHLNGAWYFATREGDQGPCPSREFAFAECKRYAVERNELEGFQKSRRDEPITETIELTLVPAEALPLAANDEEHDDSNVVYLSSEVIREDLVLELSDDFFS